MRVSITHVLPYDRGTMQNVFREEAAEWQAP